LQAYPKAGRRDPREVRREALDLALTSGAKCRHCLGAPGISGAWIGAFFLDRVVSQKWVYRSCFAIKKRGQSVNQKPWMDFNSEMPRTLDKAQYQQGFPRLLYLTRFEALGGCGSEDCWSRIAYFRFTRATINDAD